MHTLICTQRTMNSDVACAFEGKKDFDVEQTEVRTTV
jgi:hypothetical protein